MNTRSTKAAHGSIYDTLFVARASRQSLPSNATATPTRGPVNLYDASQRREQSAQQPLIQQTAKPVDNDVK